MNINEILKDKSLKGTLKREKVIDEILNNRLDINNLDFLNEKETAVILEAIEEISNKKLKNLEKDYFDYAKKYILSDNNSCKREASRIIGNLAGSYPDDLKEVIESLLLNTKDESTVVRWSSAYALSEIIILKNYRDSDLYEKIKVICDKEEEKGVKNKYLQVIKKIGK